MKKAFYILLLLMFTASCGNNPKKKTTEAALSVEDSVKVVIPRLHPTLVEGVKETIGRGNTKDYLTGLLSTGASPVSLNESMITIIFIIDPESRDIYFSDSTVHISFYHFPGHTAPVGKYYKGIIENVEGYNVGIFDIGGFGEKYYNADSIKYVPLENFKHNDFEVILTTMYYVKNGELNYWCP